MESSLKTFFALGVFLVAVISGVFLLLAFYEEGSRSSMSRWVRVVAKPWNFPAAPKSVVLDGFNWRW